MRADACQDIGAALAHHSEIAVAWLFGSVARGTASELSDIDVAVLLANGPPNRLRFPSRRSEELALAIRAMLSSGE
ncbi:MAG: nucleotidyltransferase domain-containing protein [Planctomycetes bacterium]|nr:nucleotidyltransferase domain-containing protein [Planctomycetota bacterium]